MNQKQVGRIIKGMCYTLPTYKLIDGEETRINALSLKFCNKRGNLVQEGVKPLDLIKAVSLFVEDEGYPDEEFILDILESVASLIKVAEKKKE